MKCVILERGWTHFFYILDKCKEKETNNIKKAFNEKGFKESPGAGLGCP